ncbi:MAG: hypothetical protein SPG40_06615 [Kiritimatiellia bacterium]|nr:hypothetical protein [Kiritimatiellia bacterium]
MKKEEMIKELDETLGKANVKLFNICGDKKPLEDVVLTVEHGSDAEIVRSGMNIVETIPNADAFKALKATKRAIWAVVDKTRDEVCGKSEKPEKAEKSEKKSKFDGKPLKGMAFDDLMEKVNDLLVIANDKLENMVKESGNFPYGIDDVRMGVDSDEAGIYIRSGRTPVCAVVRAGSKEGLLREIKSAVWSEVDATRSAIERRKSIKADAEALAEECEKRDKSAAALVAAGLDASILGAGCDPEAAKEIVNAAKKAVKSANRGLALYFPEAVEAIAGGLKEAKLVVKGFSGGIVILADGKPCLVSRFPKIGNNKTVEKTVAFIEADVSALGESRRKYFRMVQEKFEREIRLRELSGRIEDANGQLMSMAM